jgi:hypothetical protein
MDENELREFMEAHGYERDELRRGWSTKGTVRDDKGNPIPGRKPPMVWPFFISDWDICERIASCGACSADA